MSELTYTTKDKSAWGPGPWQEEPDKIQWTDAGTGLPCLIVRSRHLGNLCGYVGVAEGHPAFGRDYDELGYYPEVHGGLTYAAFCQEGDDAETICHVPEPGQPDRVWWLGFDCAHGGDLSPGMEAREREYGLPSFREPYARYCDVGYVKAECRSLARQLAAQT
mgnify:CR=1 FL=1